MNSHERMPLPPAEALVGSYRRMGAYGPVYKVQELTEKMGNGDALLRVHFPVTDETVNLRYSRVLLDPEET